MRYIIILLLLSSCSPQKRLNRLVKKHPELINVDTLSVHDTIHTETITADTVFKDTTFLRLLRDTITVVNDRLTIKQYYYRDSIFIQGECKGDTLVREIRVPYKYIQPVTKTKTPAYMIILLVGLIIILILLGIKSLRE